METDGLLRRAELFLEDGKWKEVHDYCERILDIEPENPKAYLYEMFAKLQVKSKDELVNCLQPFDELDLYKKVIRFDPTVKNEFESINYSIRERNETQRKDSIYSEAVNLMKSNKLSDYNVAIEKFGSIAEWKDSSKQIDICKDKIKELENINEKKLQSMKKKLLILSGVAALAILFILISIFFISPAINYKKALALANDEENYDDAIELLNKHPKYSDTQCQIDFLTLKKAINYIEDGDVNKAEYFLDLELDISSVGNEALDLALDYYEAGKKDCALIILNVLGNKPTKGNVMYSKAKEFADSNNYDMAYLIASHSDDDGDLSSIISKYYNNKFKSLNVGDTISFGNYYTENNLFKDSIDWKVLEINDGKAILISDKIIDYREYNDTNDWPDKINWGVSTLREWLNDDFMFNCFCQSEISMLVKSSLGKDANPKFDTSCGDATDDYVYLLSIDEYDKYSKSIDLDNCVPTNYADEKNYVAIYEDNWWLRTKGSDLANWFDNQYVENVTFHNNTASYVDNSEVIYEGSIVDYEFGVRPVICINID